jgi:tRNA A37 methylthiotransferase MiaB
MADDVPAAVKKARNQELLQAAERVALGRLRRHIGAELEVFVEEHEPARGRARGRSRQGLHVGFPGAAELVGRAGRVTIEDASPCGLWGRPLDGRAELAQTP